MISEFGELVCKSSKRSIIEPDSPINEVFSGLTYAFLRISWLYTRRFFGADAGCNGRILKANDVGPPLPFNELALHLRPRPDQNRTLGEVNTEFPR
jgi:hypothetical protein